MLPVVDPTKSTMVVWPLRPKNSLKYVSRYCNVMSSAAARSAAVGVPPVVVYATSKGPAATAVPATGGLGPEVGPRVATTGLMVGLFGARDATGVAATVGLPVELGGWILLGAAVEVGTPVAGEGEAGAPEAGGPVAGAPVAGGPVAGGPLAGAARVGALVAPEGDRVMGPAVGRPLGRVVGADEHLKDLDLEDPLPFPLPLPLLPEKFLLLYRPLPAKPLLNVGNDSLLLPLELQCRDFLLVVPVSDCLDDQPHDPDLVSKPWSRRLVFG